MVILLGYAGTKVAAENDGIKVIKYADKRYFTICFGLYSRITTMVYGDYILRHNPYYISYYRLFNPRGNLHKHYPAVHYKFQQLISKNKGLPCIYSPVERADYPCGCVRWMEFKNNREGHEWSRNGKMLLRRCKYLKPFTGNVQTNNPYSVCWLIEVSKLLSTERRRISF